MAAAKRGRHVPQRTCVGCRETEAKRNLIRLVRTPDGVQVDLSAKLAGRGAYVHDREICWQSAMQGPLARALRTQLSNEEQARLMEALAAQSSDDHAV